jgi:thioredoxin reductase
MASQMFDVVIVGAGPAGLNAALVLGRCRRRVLVCDEGKPRNAVSRGLHGFLSRDGLEPRELIRIAREQLAPYPSVELRSTRVDAACRSGEAFLVTLAGGETASARKVLLAGGRRDQVPDIPGLGDLWGRSVFHCRYCDGWEVRDTPLAVISASADWAGDAQLAAQLTNLSDDVAWCTNGPFELDEPARRRFERHGVWIREERIAALEGREGRLERIVFAHGPPLPRRAAFLDCVKHQHSDAAAQLGCTLLPDGCVEVGDRQQTSEPGVFAAGDTARRPTRPVTSAQIVMAAADGATAAVAIDLDLFSEE